MLEQPQGSRMSTLDPANIQNMYSIYRYVAIDQVIKLQAYGFHCKLYTGHVTRPMVRSTNLPASQHGKTNGKCLYKAYVILLEAQKKSEACLACLSNILIPSSHASLPAITESSAIVRKVSDVRRPRGNNAPRYSRVGAGVILCCHNHLTSP